MGFKSWNDREIRIFPIPGGLYDFIKAMLKVVPVVAFVVTDILLSVILLIYILILSYSCSGYYPLMGFFFLLVCVSFFCWKLWIWYQILEDEEVN